MRPARRAGIARRIHVEGHCRPRTPKQQAACRLHLTTSRRRRARGCGWALITRLAGSRSRWRFALAHCAGLRNRTLLPARERRNV